MARGSAMPKIGVPRALLYYKYFPLWKTFFEGLGAEVVVSPPTNKRILNLGTETAESEACLPVKVFYGHALALKGEVDALFVPRVVSVEGKAYTCPKFLGLPDMIKALDDDLPPVLGTTFNLRQGWRRFFASIYELGSHLTRNPLKILRAFYNGARELKIFDQKLREGSLVPEALGETDFKNLANPTLTIGVVGHPYNIFDSYVSMNLVKRLHRRGAKVLTPEMVPPEAIEESISSLPKSLFWTYEKDVVGAIFYWLENNMVNGIIYMISFACGPDSLIQVLVEQEARKISPVPLMPLVIDEHSGEAGLVTRLEAFLDMIDRKRARVH
ncbi:MAG: acyl-CoA dehydratase activase-related protein [Actinomycetota bacterium]|nr:acyl-CoA dehydratase activase-related protein [Actinomycetota bacterium]